jgi:hypothetical protein
MRKSENHEVINSENGLYPTERTESNKEKENSFARRSEFAIIPPPDALTG